MAGSDILGVGISGLQAFQKTLGTIGHNISNANTEGYSRQRVEFGTRTPTPSGDGFVGNGVKVVTTERMFDNNAQAQVRSRTATTEFYSSYNEFASQVDNLIADPDAGMSPALESFFQSIQEVANDPSSIPAREVMLTEGKATVDRFLTMDSWFKDLSKAVNNRVTGKVLEINQLAKSVADINNEIIVATGIAGGQPPNDLLDQRDKLISDLAKQVNVSIVETNIGTIDVFIGSGQSMVLGTQSMQLSARPDPDDPANVEVAYVDPSTSALTSITPSITGGDLGGVLRFRSDILLPAQNQLGRLAVGLANTFNAQHVLGLDLNSTLGVNFFTEPTLGASESVNNAGAATVSVTLSDVQAITPDEYRLTYDGANYTLRDIKTNTITPLTVAAAGPPVQFNPVFGMTLSLSAVPVVNDKFFIRANRDAARQLAVSISDPNLIAAANPLRTGIDVSTNLGNGKITETTITNNADANLLETVTITFANSGGLPSPATADQFTLVGATSGVIAAGVAYTNGGTLAYNGWEASITGSPKVGDVFTIQRNNSGVSDNRNALALANLEETGTMIGGNASYHDTYSKLVVSVGNLTHQAEISYEAQNALLKQATELRDGISGVNLDEEAANLMRFQQAYNAAAQVIAVADTVFQALINAVRG